MDSTKGFKNAGGQAGARGGPLKSRHGRPLIGVITVVLNGWGRIEKTIESISQQDYENRQYTIIDGGSTDGTLDILKKHDIQINRWISEPDRGISDAFNKGIRLAKGGLIGILNAGDWYEPNALQTIVDAYRAHPEADVFCGGLRFWEGGQPTIVA